MRIDVIGCGGIGSYLIPLLMKQVNKETEVHVWDGDKLERRNLDRQLFHPRYVGQFKAEAMSKIYKGIIPHNQYLVSADALKDSDTLFACPDNMPARRLVLEASDRFDIPSYICGNTYEAASASYHCVDLKDSPMDYRVRYAAVILDNSDDPTATGCTGEALDSAPQLAIANQISASFAMGLYWYWTEKAELVRNNPIFLKSPIEYRWAPSTIHTLTMADCLQSAES